MHMKKSTEGFQSFPYAVALFSSMLMLYYAFLKMDNRAMLMVINSIGCGIETAYLAIYLIYSPKSAKVHTEKLLIMFNLGVYGMIILLTYLLSQGPQRVRIVGWICAVFFVSVFAAPLSIMRLVIRTKECGVHAILAFILPHYLCHNVVLLWASHQGCLHRRVHHNAPSRIIITSFPAVIIGWSHPALVSTA